MGKTRLLRALCLSIAFLSVFVLFILPLNDFLVGGGLCITSVRGDNNTASYTFYNLFDIKKEAKTVTIGGFSVAMVLRTDGIIIDEVVTVDTPFGKATPCAKLQKGDFISEINGTKIHKSEDVDAYVSCGKHIKATVLRKGERLDFDITPAMEEFSDKHRLGIVVRDYIMGVGTVSYVKEDGSFGALGHPIEDSVAGRVPIRGGLIFESKELGITKSEKGKPGEMRVKINSVQPIGEIYKNTNSGVYGKFYSEDEKHMYPVGKTYPLCSRHKVNPGKATICSTIHGECQFFNIEIIRAINQSGYSDKGMVVRVTDKRLIDMTGGIIQGMSGSPIIQNGFIVGAITHVFVSDPTKGYAIYVDFMADSH